MTVRAHWLAILFALPLLNGCIVVPAPYTLKASGMFHGRVVDAQSKSPVEGAIVEITGYPKTTHVTGQSGEFTVGPARKWYGYFIVGFHQHTVPEPKAPDVVTSITVSHPGFTRVVLEARDAIRSREGTKRLFELGDVLLPVRAPTKRE